MKFGRLVRIARLASLAFGVIWVAPAALAAEPACADCHGKDGVSTETDIPKIGGLSKQYILDAMAAYQAKSRPCPASRYRSGDMSRPKTDMCQIAAGLDGAQSARIAAELAAKPFVPATQSTDPAKAALGKRIHETRCEKCHSQGGSSAADDSSILAGQWLPYLKQAFADFRSGMRPMPKKMKLKIDELTEADIEALLAYYGATASKR